MIYYILKVLSFLPFWALYRLADVAAVVLHRVVGYRRLVVRGNIDACFPEKTEAERRKIEHEFYRNFADNCVETVKLLHISDEEMMRRMEFENTAEIDRLLAEGRNIMVYFAHVFDWEWAPSVSLHTVCRPGEVAFCQVYRPLRSKTFDALMLRIRSRFHSISIPKESTLRQLLRFRSNGKLSITGFMSDQHPSHGDPGHVTTLLGRPTLMISGTETLARKLDFAAIYWDMERTGRGHYRITTRLLAEHPAELAKGELTERYTRALEATIRRNPANWLWSHNRWKHII